MSEINNEIQISIEQLDTIKKRGRPKKKEEKEETEEEKIIRAIRLTEHKQEYFKKYYLKKTKIVNDAQQFYCSVCNIHMSSCSKRNHLVTNRVHLLKCKIQELQTI
jgi:rubrerythrin